ncbi:MAG: hypothetical protein WC549_05765 [Actinomycetota bacterium]
MNDQEIKNSPKPVRKAGSYSRALFVFVVLVFILVLIFTGLTLWQDGTVRNAMQLLKYKDSYQVVFLTSGQAYFGKITEITNEYVKVKDAFSIKVQQAQAGEDSTATQSEIKLLSIEDEFYQPEGYMLIEKSAILFIEELKDSSSIIGIMENY